MGFERINLATWPRRPYYEHYMNVSRCTYSITVKIDIAALLPQVKRAEMKLYPALIYALARCVNGSEAMRYGFDAEGHLGLWDVVHPSYTVFHEDDHTFSTIWTPYAEDYGAFYTQYLDDQLKYGDVHAFAGKDGEPGNVFPVSSLPWTHFTGMNLNMFTEGTYLAPIFTIGKYEQWGGQMLLPLAVQAHHAVCDGYHVGAFLTSLQSLVDGAKKWIR